jgi:hypothetical protein
VPTLGRTEVVQQSLPGSVEDRTLATEKMTAGQPDGMRFASHGDTAPTWHYGLGLAAAAYAATGSSGTPPHVKADNNSLSLFMPDSASPIGIGSMSSEELGVLAETARKSGAPTGAGGKPILMTQSDMAAGLLPSAAILIRHFDLNVFDKAYGAKSVNVFESKGSPLYLIPVRRGLAVRLQDASIPDPIRELFNARLKKNEIKMLAMFSNGDPDSLARLLEVGRDRVARINEKIRAPEQFSLAGFEDGVAILVGHVEDGSFVLNPTTLEGHPLSISFAKIEAEAARTNTTVIYVGCESFTDITGTGYLQKIRDTEILPALKKALDADTYLDLLSSLGTVNNPFILDPKHLKGEAGRLTIETQRLHKNDAFVVGGATTVLIGLASQIRAPIKRTNVSSLMRDLYWLGAGLSIFAFRKSWQSYAKVFPSLPNNILSPVKFTLGKSVKFILFIIMLPVSVLTLTLMLLIVTRWSQREQILDLFWSIIVKPEMFHRSSLSWISRIGICIFFLMSGTTVIFFGRTILSTADRYMNSPLASVAIRALLVVAAVGLEYMIIQPANRAANRISWGAMQIVQLAVPITTVTIAVAATVVP